MYIDGTSGLLVDVIKTFEHDMKFRMVFLSCSYDMIVKLYITTYLDLYH